MKKTPKNASEKRNHIKIWYEIQQPILRALREKHYEGGVMSMLDDQQIVRISEWATMSVVKNEAIKISLKRKKRC